MKEKKFELFMCCLGNGITVCNKAVLEQNDYKIIAHISHTGKIKWYVDYLSYVPDNALIRIKNAAHMEYIKWKTWFENLTPYQQYDYLLDNVSIDDMLEVFKMKCNLKGKIEYLLAKYYMRFV